MDARTTTQNPARFRARKVNPFGVFVLEPADPVAQHDPDVVGLVRR